MKLLDVRLLSQEGKERFFISEGLKLSGSNPLVKVVLKTILALSVLLAMVDKMTKLGVSTMLNEVTYQ